MRAPEIASDLETIADELVECRGAGIATTLDLRSIHVRRVRCRHSSKGADMRQDIEVKLIAYCERWDCTVCGCGTRKFSIRGAWSDVNSQFCVCEQCIQAGDIDSRLNQRAAHLVSEAEWVRGLVGRLKVPTFA